MGIEMNRYMGAARKRIVAAVGADIESLQIELDEYKRKYREVLTLVSERVLGHGSECMVRPIVDRSHPNCSRLQEIVDAESIDGVLA